MYRNSAATRKGIDELMYKVWQELQTLPPLQYYESEYVSEEPESEGPEDITVTIEDDTYILEGEWLMLIARDINFEHHEGVCTLNEHCESRYFRALRGYGHQNGDTVRIYDLEFEYIE